MSNLIGVDERGVRVGETHHRAKLSDADIDLIRDLAEAGLSYRQIAEKFDDGGPVPSKSTIRDVVKCRRRYQVAIRWKRKKFDHCFRSC